MENNNVLLNKGDNGHFLFKLCEPYGNEIFKLFRKSKSPT